MTTTQLERMTPTAFKDRAVNAGVDPLIFDELVDLLGDVPQDLRSPLAVSALWAVHNEPKKGGKGEWTRN